MHELLGAKGLVGVGECVVYVTDVKGPLEDGWEEMVQTFATELLEKVPAGRFAAGDPPGDPVWRGV
jgi:hypothetical protein